MSLSFRIEGSIGTKKKIKSEVTVSRELIGAADQDPQINRASIANFASLLIVNVSA